MLVVVIIKSGQPIYEKDLGASLWKIVLNLIFHFIDRRRNCRGLIQFGEMIGLLRCRHYLLFLNGAQA